MTTIPRAELERRARDVQERMAATSPPLDAVLVVQNVDQWWLAGTLQTAHLIVPAAGAPRLLVRKVLERARDESALEHIEPLRSLRDLPGELSRACGSRPRRVGMELDVVPAALARTYASILGEEVEIVDASPLILAARAVKSEWEIGELRRSAECQRRVFERIPEILREGVSTWELQTRLDAESRLLGHCGAVRLRGLNAEAGIGVVVSGETGALPGHSMFPIGGAGPHPIVPGGGSREPIRRGTPVILDYLVSVSGYHSDTTRMAALGAMPDEAMDILATMQAALRFAEGEIRAGVAPSAIYERVVAFVKDRGLGERFMGPPGLHAPFIGHGVGLEVNETPVLAPRFDEPLIAGNTLAVEPKYTHPRFGVIGLENTYVVRSDGVELLTETPEEPIICP